VIGNFPQGKNAIYLDYEELVKKARSDIDLGVIKKLLSNVTPDSIDNNPPELTNYGKESERLNLDDNPMDKLNLAVPSDASQDVVVLASQSQSSQCTVVRGPPGAGKSQVIVNLISNALANGQKVLLVCQKRAALDIVYQRLDKLGVSKYMAFLHDAVSGRPLLYKRLASILLC
jgi:primosomal protein N'